MMSLEEKYPWYNLYSNNGNNHKKVAVLVIKTFNDLSKFDTLNVIFVADENHIFSWDGIDMPMPTPEEMASVTQEEMDVFANHDPLGLVVDTDGFLVYGGDQYLEEKELELESIRQSQKTLEQKSYENKFFDIISQVLTLSGSTIPDPIPKLGFAELNELLEGLQATHTQDVIFLSLKLLSVDSALKRYDTLWWEDAYYHKDILV